MQAKKNKPKDDRKYVIYARVSEDLYKKVDSIRVNNGQTWQGFINKFLRDFVNIK